MISIALWCDIALFFIMQFRVDSLLRALLQRGKPTFSPPGCFGDGLPQLCCVLQPQRGKLSAAVAETSSLWWQTRAIRCVRT